MILVSACLAGYNCAYDGKARTVDAVVDLVKQGKAIPVCPEQLGGLCTPRPACECMRLGNLLMVLDQAGNDYTDSFVRGAQEALKIAQRYDCDQAILKSNSPSCGIRCYDGTFTKTLTEHAGITAQILIDHDITVISSDNLANVI